MIGGESRTFWRVSYDGGSTECSSEKGALDLIEALDLARADGGRIFTGIRMFEVTEKYVGAAALTTEEFRVEWPGSSLGRAS